MIVSGEKCSFLMERVPFTLHILKTHTQVLTLVNRVYPDVNMGRHILLLKL